MFKYLIQKKLERYTKRYLKKHRPKLVVVAGSVGKTSTKTAIATVLGEKYRVRMESGNHNTEMSVPLAILGIKYPENIRSMSAWQVVFKAAEQRIEDPNEAEVIVQELGTDRPGDVPRFRRYLKPDIAVVTAVSPEHMEKFITIDGVAKEELSVAKFSKLTVINRDDIDSQFAKYAKTSSITTYGLSEPSEYRLILDQGSPLEGRTAKLITPEWGDLPVSLQLVGDHSTKAAAGAAAVAAKLGLNAEEVATGLAKITPVPGRMQLLRGANESIIIDDTYNSSPLAAVAAIKTLQEVDAPKRLLIFGSMNELGDYTVEAHKLVAEACDPAKLEFVITVGRDAAEHLAPVAKRKGCQVKSFRSPYEAGGFARALLSPGTVVLVKGSQNNIFTEEAIKILLSDISDADKLVRQSPDWMAIKEQQFDTSPLTDD